MIDHQRSPHGNEWALIWQRYSEPHGDGRIATHSDREMAEICGVSYGVVRQARVRHNIKPTTARNA